MKKILLALFVLFGLSVSAQAAICSAVPNTFVNGQVADANAVNADFAAIVSCLNAGAATAGANGNITSLAGLTTPLSQAQGGTGSATGVTFTQNGTGAVGNTFFQRFFATPLYASDFMTSTQFADGTARTDSIDVWAALQACINAAQTQIKNCYLSAGKWKVSGGQLVINNNAGNAVNNAPFLLGDGAATVIDMSANTSTGDILIEATGGTGTGGSAQSTTYGGVYGITVICQVAAPCIQNGLANFFDAMNQQLFQNVSVQNLNSGSSSICYQFNANYSLTLLNVNCSSAAGAVGGNDLFQFRNVSFPTLISVGGSNGQTLFHLTTGVNTGFTVNSIDCEVVKTCVAADSASTVNNNFIGGTWSWNWLSTGANAVSASNGGELNIFNVNQNANTVTGSAGTFLSSGSAAFAALWQKSTIAPLASPTFTGLVSMPNLKLTSLVTGTPVYYLCLDAGANVLLSSTAC